MDYKDRIQALSQKIPIDIVDFSRPRQRSKPPTQAFSEFLTNREQGDWAERVVRTAINKINKQYVAVQYGRSDNIVAGEQGFNEFYERYQDELDAIGKRPDILIFNIRDYDPAWRFDISLLSTNELAGIVPKAVAGIEIRSSSFLIEKYDSYVQQELNSLKAEILRVRQDILDNYQDILTDQWRKVVKSITADNAFETVFRLPTWRSGNRQVQLKERLKDLKELIEKTQKRDFLSFTPKVEDILIVHKWIQTYNVPYFYFQVFFDKVFGISFEAILELLGDKKNRDTRFYLERDTKNQQKTTIKINVREGWEIAYRIQMPEHRSILRELDRGRLLYHVTFEGGEAFLDTKNLFGLLGLS